MNSASPRVASLARMIEPRLCFCVVLLVAMGCAPMSGVMMFQVAIFSLLQSGPNDGIASPGPLVALQETERFFRLGFVSASAGDQPALMRSRMIFAEIPVT